MKKFVVILAFIFISGSSFGQSYEAQQLLLNVEKLAQFKKILQNMKDAYKILHTGYTTIKNISEGNFSLHRTFLDGLFQVSPTVRNYKRVADIIQYQIRIVKDSKVAMSEFRSSKQFTTSEVEYLSTVYGNLVNGSLKNLDELLMVVTAGKLRMSDDERLQVIDRIYTSTEGQYRFLREFNNQTYVLSLQRKSEQAEIELSRRIGGH